MSDPKPFASLSPTLLARKGGAKPAMRPQLQPLTHYADSLARTVDDDLGWNDMGHDDGFAGANDGPADEPHSAEIVSIHAEPPVLRAPVPPIVRQQAEVAQRIAAGPPRERRSALADGRRAAFTLRLDGERHLKLRLACTTRNRSAQQLVTEAIDRLLAELTDVTALAAQVTKTKR